MCVNLVKSRDSEYQTGKEQLPIVTSNPTQAAVSRLAFRTLDPVYGCVGAVALLQQQISNLQVSGTWVAQSGVFLPTNVCTHQDVNSWHACIDPKGTTPFQWMAFFLEGWHLRRSILKEGGFSSKGMPRVYHQGIELIPKDLVLFQGEKSSLFVPLIT
jgi:hypothetical protein